MASAAVFGMINSWLDCVLCVQADLHDLPLSVDTFGTKFDVVLIDPPWEEYVRRAPGVGQGESWSWQAIKNLEIDKITDNPSFVFLWWVVV